MVLLFYSFTSVLSKLAAETEGIWFFVLYGSVLACLGIYAVLWQLLLKRFSLITAFANKAIVIVWGIIWGKIIFGETITWNKILGAVIIMAGILTVVREKNE